MYISFIGSVGIPNCYGGFEAFLEAITPLMVKSDVYITVTCDATKYSNKNPFYKGVNRLFINTKANGFLSPLHDLLAFCKIFKRSDVIIVLGVSAGPFFLLMRIFCSFFNKKLIINIDGIEWRRSKYSFFSKIILRVFDYLAQICAHRIIYDNAELINFINFNFRSKAFLIPYSGDHVLRLCDIANVPSSGLSICRIEPENNIELILNAVVRSTLKSFTFIGNWNYSPYGISLRNKFKDYENLRLLDPVYDPYEIAIFRESCSVYIHGHSVGGTNPSLVEMLSYDAEIICFDCVFNRETVGDDALYFSSSSDLINILNQAASRASSSVARILPIRYTSEYISNQYIKACIF